MSKDDYILRSDALKAILGVSIYDTIEELDGARTIAENTWADGLWDAYKIIEEEVDAADVEPVIHCKDCIHGFSEIGHEPDVHCSWWDYPMPPVGFCSKAMRKEGEE